jgi:hypothetical protein
LHSNNKEKVKIRNLDRAAAAACRHLTLLLVLVAFARLASFRLCPPSCALLDSPKA